MVSVEVVALAPGVREAGENVHEDKVGRPVQESWIALVNEPNFGLTVTV